MSFTFHPESRFPLPISNFLKESQLHQIKKRPIEIQLSKMLHNTFHNGGHDEEMILEADNHGTYVLGPKCVIQWIGLAEEMLA